MKRTAEAVIIGGGVMGCSVLYHLAQLGMNNVALVEQDVLGSGSTGRSQAILRMHYSNPITAGMAWRSLKVFQDFNELVGYDSGYVKTGYVVIVGPEERGPLEENVAMQRNLGIDTGMVSSDDLEELAPMLKADDTGGIAYEPQSGYADPYQVTTAYAQRAKELGAKIYLRCVATKILVRNGKVVGVTTDQGTIETPKVLIAAGPWAHRILQDVGVEVSLKTIRHQIVRVDRPQSTLPSHPAVGDIAQEFSFRPDSTNLTLVGIGEELVDAGNYNQGVDSDIVEEAIVKLVYRMPAMYEGRFLGGWAGLFTVTPDWHPIMDRVADVDGLYCAVGFSGHGFKLSPMVGVCMAEFIAAGEATTFDITPFRMTRFQEGDLLRSRYRYNVLA